MLKKLTDLKNDKLGLKVIFHSIMGIVILILGGVLAPIVRDLFYDITGLEYSLMFIIMLSILNIVISIGLIYLYITKLLKLSLSEFRIARPKSILVWLLCAILLPLLVSGFFLFFAQGTLNHSHLSNNEIMEFLVQSIFLTCLVPGIVEEIIFRGLLMRLIEKRWNIKVAIIIPSLLFGALHILNMSTFNIADITLLLIAGTAVGIMFSLIAYQSNSIWASALVHGIWNLVIIGKIINIAIEPMEAIYTYTLKSNSMLLTGGEFGIEASLPATIGYILVIIFTLGLISKKKNRVA